MKRFTLLLGFLLLFNLTAGLAGAAADHMDTAGTSQDPIADLADLYAFVDPKCVATGGTGCEADPTELIIALTLNPMATGAEQFSEDVIYHLNFENDAGSNSQIDCSFTASQHMTCTGKGGLEGLEAQARVGEVGVNGDLRVFAGLRDDPMFFDLEAQERFSTMGIAAYTEPGTDSLAGSNVLAIVLGIRITAMPAGESPDHNLYKIWAASERIGGAGINAAISGSWYNPNQNGQGWVIEVINGTQGEMKFLSYFYGYDNNGEQLWLITDIADVDGHTVTADAFRTSATGFGGDYDPTSFVLGEVVGTVTFEFDGCNTGTAEFTSADTDVLADFTQNVFRLSSIFSLDCSFLTAGQVDRVGRPFIAEFIPSDMREAYNANSDPETWGDDYSAVLLDALQVFATADGDPAWNGYHSAEQWADIFADDRLQIDVKKAQSVDYLSIELSKLVPQDWNDSAGRRLDYDVHETTFNVLLTGFDPFVDDFLDGNDVPFLEDFPFLAPPH